MYRFELKRWLEDCIRNAKANGLNDDDILIAFIDEIMFLLITESITLEGEIVLLLLKKKANILEEKGVVYV